MPARRLSLGGSSCKAQHSVLEAFHSMNISPSVNTGFDLIIFDCDGVLVDSEIIAAQVESRLLTEAGYPISVEEMGERFSGMTWKNIRVCEAPSIIAASATELGSVLKNADMKKIVNGRE